MRIILSSNPYRDKGLRTALEADRILRKAGAETVLCLPFVPRKGDRLDLPRNLSLRQLEEELPRADLLVCFGGDGTILHAARDATLHGVPILGVNMGSVGFMAELERTELSLLVPLAQGHFVTEERMMLDVQVFRGGRPVSQDLALNDAVFSKGSMARVAEVEVWADQTTDQRIMGDGGIVATPTGPTALETDPRPPAMGLRTDPELGELNTPSGHMSFLQVVGITEDEMDAMMCWDGKKFLHALSERLPLCVTDLSRTSMMDNATFHKVWQEGMEQDGSSTGFLYMDELGVRLESGHVSLRLGAGHIQVLLRMLQARVGKGRSLLLQGSEHAVLFQPGQQAAVGMEDSTTTLTLPENTLRELQTIVRPHAGAYPLTSFPMAVELVPTKITDCNGNIIKVVE